MLKMSNSFFGKPTRAVMLRNAFQDSSVSILPRTDVAETAIKCS